MAGLCIVSHCNGLGVYQYKNAVNRIKELMSICCGKAERYLQSADTGINYTGRYGS